MGFNRKRVSNDTLFFVTIAGLRCRVFLRIWRGDGAGGRLVQRELNLVS
jgi:hypothetical protein